MSTKEEEGEENLKNPIMMKIKIGQMKSKKKQENKELQITFFDIR